jgi:hypothetical protein
MQAIVVKNVEKNVKEEMEKELILGVTSGNVKALRWGA